MAKIDYKDGGFNVKSEGSNGDISIRTNSAVGDIEISTSSGQGSIALASNGGVGDISFTAQGGSGGLDFTSTGPSGISMNSQQPIAISCATNSADNKTLSITSTNSGAGYGALNIISDLATIRDNDFYGFLSYYLIGTDSYLTGESFKTSFTSSATAGNDGVLLYTKGSKIKIGCHEDATYISGDIDIGTGATAKTITLGNATGATVLDIDSGTGGISMNTTGTMTFQDSATGPHTLSDLAGGGGGEDERVTNWAAGLALKSDGTTWIAASSVDGDLMDESPQNVAVLKNAGKYKKVADNKWGNLTENVEYFNLSGEGEIFQRYRVALGTDGTTIIDATLVDLLYGSVLHSKCEAASGTNYSIPYNQSLVINSPLWKSTGLTIGRSGAGAYPGDYVVDVVYTKRP